MAELLYGVAEAMHFALDRGCYHRRLEPRDVFIDAQGQASIVNIFRPADSRIRDPREEVAALVAIVETVAAEGKARGLITSLVEQPRDWAGLMDALDDVRDAMRERSIMRRIEAESGQSGAGSSSIPWWFWVSALIAVGIVFSWETSLAPPPLRLSPQADFEGARAGGDPRRGLSLPKNERRSLPTFWISRHEVTLGQYADFLAALTKAPRHLRPPQPAQAQAQPPSAEMGRHLRRR